MPKRYSPPRIAAALRDRLKEGYSVADFRADLMAGIVVAMVAVPLGMALAIASGVAPQYGLYTVIIGGAIVALLGGSRLAVTGPTAAFVVILAPITSKFGLSGLLVAGLMAGVLLIGFALARLGRLLQYIPLTVTTGFTCGIAIVIATLQLKDFFGLQIVKMPETYLGKVSALLSAGGTMSGAELGLGAFTLIFLVLWPRLRIKIPAPLVALTFASVGAVVLEIFFPDLKINTIGNRFTFEINGIIGHGIPQVPPHLDWPWNHIGGDGVTFTPSFEAFQALVPGAFAIAMLGAIESLLCAVVGDSMAGTKHDPDGELLGLGIGNVLCPFFGGIAATGAIARTATNIRYGARSPLAALIHAVVTLLVILLFAPIVGYLPMAALAALLMFVAYNMSEIKHFAHIMKAGKKSDIAILLVCFSLTVIFDMVIGVTAGVILAVLLGRAKIQSAGAEAA